jgi:hypothetical protein
VVSGDVGVVRVGLLTVKLTSDDFTLYAESQPPPVPYHGRFGRTVYAPGPVTCTPLCCCIALSRFPGALNAILCPSHEERTVTRPKGNLPIMRVFGQYPIAWRSLVTRKSRLMRWTAGVPTRKATNRPGTTLENTTPTVRPNPDLSCLLPCGCWILICTIRKHRSWGPLS